MTKQYLGAGENILNLPSNWKVSKFYKTAKRKQGVFEKSTGQTPLYFRFRYCWITLVFFAPNFVGEIHLFTTNIEKLLTISSFLGCICRHPMLHRADTPHVWLYTVFIVIKVKILVFLWNTWWSLLILLIHLTILLIHLVILEKGIWCSDITKSNE